MDYNRVVDIDKAIEKLQYVKSKIERSWHIELKFTRGSYFSPNGMGGGVRMMEENTTVSEEKFTDYNLVDKFFSRIVIKEIDMEIEKLSIEKRYLLNRNRWHIW